MKLSEIKIGPVERQSHNTLYHITDAHGFAYSIQNDWLKSLRQTHISTTFNPNINSIYGRQGLLFKFVLNGAKLYNEYGGYTYVDTYQEIGFNSRKTREFKEDEVRINTDVIQPLSDYVERVVILEPLFTKSFIRMVSHHNVSYKGFMDNEKSEAIAAIIALYKVIAEWRIPVTVLDNGNERPLEKNEIVFIRTVQTMAKKKDSLDKILRKLVGKYDIEDRAFFGNNDHPIITKQLLDRQKNIPKINALIETLYRKKMRDITPKMVKMFWTKVLTLLKIDPDTVIPILENNGLLHPVIPPVEWVSSIKELIYDRMDEFLKDVDYIKHKYKRQIDDWDNRKDNFSYEYGRHNLSSLYF